MQKNHTSQKLAAIRQRLDAANDELMHLEQLDLQVSGQSEYVDSLADLFADAMTIDGRDERRTAKALSYAGFATSWH